jgi:hypothetical protein
MSEETLYRKTMKGKRVVYEAVTPEAEPETVVTFTDKQAITAAGALGVTLLIVFERIIPPHKRVARKIKAVENAILDLFHGTGESIDDEICQVMCRTWDETMKRISAEGDNSKEGEMIKEELAVILNGREYGDEITKGEEKQAKDSGLVVVFGYSDDNVELRGAINDEIGAYDGTTLYFDGAGLLQNKCNDDDCPYFAASKKSAETIEVKPDYSGNGEYMWSYETAIPHATFDVMEDGEKYCRGIVFSLADLG